MSSEAPKESNGYTGLPAWARIIALVGVPSAIALFLVYALATAATASLSHVEAVMQQHATVSERHDQDAKEATDDIRHLLLVICVNASQTAEEQRRCVSGR